MSQRTRTFVGVTPEGTEVMVSIFEEVDALGAVLPRPDGMAMAKIVGMEVAFKADPEDRFSRWSPPIEMTEED